MNPEMQKRLYEMEVTPPQAVWEKLSVNIDEINEDNLVAQKVLNTELTPPIRVWEKIDSTINVVEERRSQKKGTIINLRRLAVAALFIGVIATGWILMRNNSSSGLTTVEDPVQESSSTNTKKENKDPNFIDSPIDLNRPTLAINKPAKTSSTKNIAEVFDQSQSRKRNNSSRSKNDLSIQPTTAQFASLNEPLEKSFNEPIDDLSLVTSNQNYLTMVNANGRLVKIPAQLASLAPHLQDKPVSEDYYEVMFGEGAYWKETLNEWRKKVASAPVSTGDAFTSFVELLKNVQNR